MIKIIAEFLKTTCYGNICLQIGFEFKFLQNAHKQGNNVLGCVLVHITNSACSETSVDGRPTNLILLHYEELLVSKCDAVQLVDCYKRFRRMCCLYLQVTRVYSEDRGSTVS
jgi:predicted proteasome-type protease